MNLRCAKFQGPNIPRFPFSMSRPYHPCKRCIRPELGKESPSFPSVPARQLEPSPQRLRHVGMEKEPPCFLAQTFRRSVLSAPVAESPRFTPYPNTHTQGFESHDTMSTNRGQEIIALDKSPRAFRRPVEVIPLGGGDNASRMSQTCLLIWSRITGTPSM
jgi:hypothetical protein